MHYLVQAQRIKKSTPKQKPQKNFLYFLKRKLFLYFGKRKPLENSLYIIKRKFFIFQQVTSRARKVELTLRKFLIFQEMEFLMYSSYTSFLESKKFYIEVQNRFY